MAKYCPNCGALLEEKAEFCGKCGKKVNSKTNNQNVNNTYTGSKSKSKIAAGILGILLGCFGAHNFYLGYTGKAVAQLLITLLTCGILGVVSEIWGLVEGILILTGSIDTDAEGNPLID